MTIYLNMLQKTKFKIALYATIFTILLVILGFWIYFASAQARDYQRLADLRVWQNILASYYLQNGSYQIPNCDQGETLSQCLITKVGKSTINNINDPINSGSYRYAVNNLSAEDYEIIFSLEAGIGGLSRGSYVLNKNGIQR